MRLDSILEKSEKSEKLINELADANLTLSKKQEKDILEFASKCDGHTHYISILNTWKRKIVECTFACRKYKGKPEYMEVQRKLEGNYYKLVKNQYQSSMGGLKTIWHNTRFSWYYWSSEWNNEWYIEKISALDSYYDIKAYNKIPFKKYQYASFDFKGGNNLIIYLATFEKYPMTEMLSKLGLSYLLTNSVLLRDLQNPTKSKALKKWLFKYHNEILEVRNKASIVNHSLKYNDIKRCIKLGITPKEYKEIQEDEFVNMMLTSREINTEHIDMRKLRNYLKEKNIDMYTYADFMKSVQYLNLDMTMDKNKYPHNFNEMHDLYTKQYNKTKEKDLNKKLAAIKEMYKAWQISLKGLTVIMPSCKQDFIKEGKAMENCVGRMGYDERVVKGESLIFFVRKDNEINKSFMTMELDPKRKEIRQLYGKKNSNPDKDIADIIRKTWLNKIKKIKIESEVIKNAK